VINTQRDVRYRWIIEGIFLLYLPREYPATAALDRIDEQLGGGIATPDHVLTVANGGVDPDGEVGPCPATEPQEVYKGVGPYPPICANGGDGVHILIADTHWIDPVTKAAPWMEGVKGQAAPGPLPRRPNGQVDLKRYDAHGTFVAGLVRAMAPDADIYVDNIFKVAGSALESDAVSRLRRALDERPDTDIFHVSVAASTRKARHLLAFEKWLDLISRRKGLVCIAPAGNNESLRPHWPGAFPSVVSVGALAMDWRSRAYFTNYGPWVDAYAPGTNLINAYTDGEYECQLRPYTGTIRMFDGLAQWSGTSFSAPVVTGLIAARMTRTGESAAQAAVSLLAQARGQSVPGTGPILLPELR
jgi:subtilisin family serine protease